MFRVAAISNINDLTWNIGAKNSERGVNISVYLCHICANTNAPQFHRSLRAPSPHRGVHMQHIVDVIARRTGARALLLAVITLPVVFYLGFTPSERSAVVSTLALQFTRYVAPSLLIAGAVGWLAYSWQAFLGTAIAVFALVTIIQLVGLYP